MKVIRCRDVGFDCEHKIRAETEEGILNQAAEHARTCAQCRSDSRNSFQSENPHS